MKLNLDIKFITNAFACIQLHIISVIPNFYIKFQAFLTLYVLKVGHMRVSTF